MPADDGFGDFPVFCPVRAKAAQIRLVITLRASLCYMFIECENSVQAQPGWSRVSETSMAKKNNLNLVAVMVASVLAPFFAAPLPAQSSPGSAASSVNSLTRASGILLASNNATKNDGFQHHHTYVNVDADEQEIIQTALDGKLYDAEMMLERVVSKEQNDSRKNDLCYMLAALEKMQEKSNEARKHLEQVLHHQPPAKDAEGQMRHALLLKRIGDCYYGERKFKDALASYNAALMISAAQPSSSRILADLYESAMGILIIEKRYDEAQHYGEKLLAVTTERAKSGLWDDYGVLFWAQLQMLNLYRHMKNPPDLVPMQRMVSASLDNLLNYRFSLESQGKLPSLAERKEIFEKHYIDEFDPQSAAEYIWLAGEFRLRTLPVIGWLPEQKPAKAAILCVHGLGLDNHAFTRFGYQMSQKGYAVYAMDVRGFGAWLTTPGQEELRLNEAINDVGSVLGLISDRHEDTPIYLLGESMGGAIALRAGAKFSKNLHGVISSVPSAERFQARKMGLTVAVHFLNNPNKPFRVGDMVTQQATAIPQVREAWHDDLKAKMEMTPKELMKFAVFMRETKQVCSKLNSLPVFFVQGLKDRLVKPKGTYELFDAVTSQDKDLFIIGSEEHLIFETFKQSNMLLEALTSWMQKHSLSLTPSAQAANSSAAAPAIPAADPASGSVHWAPGTATPFNSDPIVPGSVPSDPGISGKPAQTADSAAAVTGKSAKSKAKRKKGS